LLQHWSNSFITIDNLLDEEDVDPFMDDETESVMTLVIDEMSKI
jgi:hypothetical protein